MKRPRIQQLIFNILFYIPHMILSLLEIEMRGENTWKHFGWSDNISYMIYKFLFSKNARMPTRCWILQ